MDFPEETVTGWGMSSQGRTFVARPKSKAELIATVEAVRAKGLSLGPRGAGCSYGDAATNTGGATVDFRALNHILSFDVATGRLRAEPGVTIEQIWRTTLAHGWWPPVVPGTMFPTLGGCAAMNIHGKNNFQLGTIGEHIDSFELLLADGTVKRCSQSENEDLFRAAIGGFGMLGCFTELSLRLKKVHSGNLRVHAEATRTLAEMIAFFESEHAHSDYLVGWVDAIGGGRGLIHQAWYLKEGEDPDPAASFDAGKQDLPSRLFFAIPKSWMWPGLWCFLNKPGMRLVNALKYASGRREARRAAHLQSLVGFSFLLDYVPNWKYAYRPGGLIQYQAFVPKADASFVFEAQLRMAKDSGILPYLGVLKKHRPDPFLMTHAVDGYSLALDFPVKSSNRHRLWALARQMDEVVSSAGGRFYFAKDSTMTPETFRRVYPAPALDRFRQLKDVYDPGNLFQTDLSRRIGL